MPMNRPGSVSKTSTPSSAATRGEEVRPRRRPVDLAQPARPDPVQPHERRDVDELDHGRDHDRGQRRLGQALEQAGEEQQRDDGEHGDDEPRDLAVRPGAAVDRGLGEAAVDDHAARQPGAEVGRAEADQLAVGVDLVVVARRVGLGRAEALGEADERDADGARRQVRGSPRRARRGARPAAARCRSCRRCRRRPGSTQLDDQDPDRHRHERPRDDGREPAQPEHERERAEADRQRRRARVPERCRAGPRAARRSRRRPSRRRTASAAGRR